MNGLDQKLTALVSKINRQLETPAGRICEEAVSRAKSAPENAHQLCPLDLINKLKQSH